MEKTNCIEKFFFQHDANSLTDFRISFITFLTKNNLKNFPSEVMLKLLIYLPLSISKGDLMEKTGDEGNWRLKNPYISSNFDVS